MKEVVVGLLLIIALVSLATKCEIETKALRSKECYEQTKNDKCWDLK